MAPQLPGALVDAQWLSRHLGQDGLVIADCRFVLSDPQAGRKAYESGHIPTAVYFDLDADLSAPPGEGGRHPLPDVQGLAAKLGAAGIDASTAVVCYDDQKGSMAARLWWLLRYLGHEAVAVLDGGYSAWVKAGSPVTAEKPQPRARTFQPRLQPHMVVDMEELRRQVEQGTALLVDSRAAERYRGDIEPLDPVAGHIPGAVNMPWEGNWGDDGFLKSPEEIRARWQPVLEQRDPREIIVYCGSGVTACANLLALERVGVTGVKLYAGGWSQWCRHPENPVATGDEGITVKSS